MTETVQINGNTFRVVSGNAVLRRNDGADPSPASSTKRRSKYNAQAVVVDGVRFASKAEAARDFELHTLERAGQVRNVKRQPRYPLYVEGKLITTYVADWCYQEFVDGELVFVAEDRKGVQTKEFKIKWALAKALHPEIEWRLS